MARLTLVQRLRILVWWDATNGQDSGMRPRLEAGNLVFRYATTANELREGLNLLDEALRWSIAVLLELCKEEARRVPRHGFRYGVHWDRVPDELHPVEGEFPHEELRPPHHGAAAWEGPDHTDRTSALFEALEWVPLDVVDKGVEAVVAWIEENISPPRAWAPLVAKLSQRLVKIRSLPKATTG
jgi:hypothetical protein